MRVLKLRWGGFRLRDAISRKRCKIELRWVAILITNRKSYMDFQLQQKSMTLYDLKRQCTALYESVVGVMHVVTKRLRLESRFFSL